MGIPFTVIRRPQEVTLLVVSGVISTCLKWNKVPFHVDLGIFQNIEYYF
jgi:hypothetical protein